MTGAPNGVLIVEDESEIRGLLRLVFEAESFTVYHAGDGVEALEQFTANAGDIALVITDLGLPRLGGVELIEKVRALKPSVKIIGSSGYSRANIREEVMNAGGDMFIAKPYVVAQLIKSSKDLLGRE
jgi:DNA-binding response OmpR family regulator